MDIPVPHCRGGRGGGGGLQGSRLGQNPTAFLGAEHVDVPVSHGGGLPGLRPRQVSAASSSHSPGDADEALTGVFALSPVRKKVRGWVRTRGRN